MKYLTDDLSFKEQHPIGKAQVFTISKRYVDLSKLVILVNMRTIIYGLTVLFLFLMQFEIEMNGKIPESNKLYLKLNYRLDLEAASNFC